MRIIDPTELSCIPDLSVDALFAMQQTWGEGAGVFAMAEPRRQNALLYFAGISGRYRLADGRTVDAPRGSVVLLPEGSTYVLDTRDPISRPHTLLVEFRLFSDGETLALGREPCTVLSAGEDEQAVSLVQKFTAEYAMLGRPYLKLRRDLYALLARLAARAEERRISLRGFKTIEKGILHLQKEERETLSIREIAEMCYVSPTYFRRLFREYAGVSPAAWRTRRRMEQAKALLAHADLGIAAIAEQLGYADPSYFCRVFKREVGISPTAYQKTVENDEPKGEKHE